MKIIQTHFLRYTSLRIMPSHPAIFLIQKTGFINAALGLTILFAFLAVTPTLRAQSQEELQLKLASKIERVQRLAKAPVLVESVKAQNAKKISLDKIKKIDEIWKKGDAATQEATLKSKASLFLSNTLNRNKAIYSEAFVTDNQGANVGCAPATSDYWQGDEEKFTASFASGKGKVFIGPIEKDQSSGAEAVQISVPIKDGSKTIGVLIVGVKLSYIEAH